MKDIYRHFKKYIIGAYVEDGSIKIVRLDFKNKYYVEIICNIYTYKFDIYIKYFEKKYEFIQIDKRILLKILFDIKKECEKYKEINKSYMLHELKINKQYFKEVSNRKKTFEIRKNDREFKVGDFVKLKEIDENKKYTGNEELFEITYLTNYAQKENYVVFAISPISKSQFRRLSIQRGKSNG